jgi:hypothetical protein
MSNITDYDKYLGKYITFDTKIGDKTLITTHKGTYKISGYIKIIYGVNNFNNFKYIGTPNNDEYTYYFLFEFISGCPYLCEINEFILITKDEVDKYF